MRWKLKAAAAVLAASLATVVAAQSPAKGKLLVATDEMANPSFEQTVVLLLHHDENGTIGVAVNRPTWVEPGEVSSEIGSLGDYDGTVFHGGPLGPTQLIYLVRDPPPDTFEAPPIVGRIYASGNLDILGRLIAAGEGTSSLRLYAGHLEWAAGQLEQEIASDQWRIVEGTAERVFAPEPEKLWSSLGTGGEELLVGVPSVAGRAGSAGGRE